MRVLGRVISYVVLVLIGLVGIAPFVYLLVLSFKARIDILEVPPTLHFEWSQIKENYDTVIHEPSIVGADVDMSLTALSPGGRAALRHRT